MKTSTLLLILFLAALGVQAQTPPSATNNVNAQAILRKIMARRHGLTNGLPTMPGFPGAGASANFTPPAAAQNNSASDPNNPAANADANSQPPEETVPPGFINFQGVDVSQVLDVYAQLVNRTLIRGPLPQASIVLKTQTALTKTEAIQVLQAVLALNNISVINVGDKFVKVLSSDQANSAAGEIDHTDGNSLPELGSYVTHIVQLKYIKPSEMVPIIQPFARLQNSILPIDSNGILVLRDYAENVKRMLEMIDQIDVSVPAEYISEVIPIKYAQAEDIANALNSLGGQGGSTVSFGGSGSAAPISGFHGGGTSSGISGTSSVGGGGYQSGGVNGAAGQSRPFGATTSANGTPSSGTTFQQRLQSIINRASTPGQPDQIQVFGQAKIIADSRANALLVFATRSDMESIKHVISQLDVLLSQVLIEAVIMDVSLGHTFNLGISAAQNPQQLGTSSVIGGGGFNNGQSFLNTITTLTTNYQFNGTNLIPIPTTITSANTIGTNSGAFGSSLASGFSYFGNIGPSWDVALQALQSDNTATVIQRPRIQTSQAKEAQFFVGSTVPYVDNTTYGSAYGNNSSYSQLSVGVELDVTPFINPDGLVVMDINQEIDDISGYTTIDGNSVPNTDKRTLSSEIAVKDRDTIILGGFIRSDKSHSKSGVPFLSSIPLLGNLFTQRNDQKDRQELIVLMRPTVLKTPDIAALNTIKEEQRLPGVSAAAADDAADERDLIDTERKAELKRAKHKGSNDGFYNAYGVDSTNAPPPDSTASPADGSGGYFNNTPVTPSTNAPSLLNQ